MAMNNTHPDAQRAFEEHLAAMPDWAPEFEVHRPWVEKLLREAWDSARSQRPAAPSSFEQYWTEDGRNLCKSPLDSVEARMHKRTWDAATERAAKEEREHEPFGYVLHWPKIGGGRELLFDKSRAAGDAIGCKVTPVYEAAPAVLVNDEVWPKYIAGIIETYIKQNRTDEDREAGIAKIIERRMYSMASPRGAK
jgi:hypothetical protein